MAIDFSECEIINPAGQRLIEMYEKLRRIFISDRYIYDQLIDEGINFYTMTNYALYHGNDLLGNVGLYPVSIWFDNEPLEIVGAGAVATINKYRHQGVAKYLLQNCMKVIDEKKKPSALFTSLLDVYNRCGFQEIEQQYMSVKTCRLHFKNVGFKHKYMGQIGSAQTEPMQNIYENEYPNYNGKVIRTTKPDYWQVYRMMFNPYENAQLVWCLSQKNKLLGYLRFEISEDRLTVTELCCSGEKLDVAESLLNSIENLAKAKALNLVSFALPSEHIFWGFLKSKSIEFFPESTRIHREKFMIRPPVSQNIGKLARLQWSLADKF